MGDRCINDVIGDAMIAEDEGKGNDRRFYYDGGLLSASKTRANVSGEAVEKSYKV